MDFPCIGLWKTEDTRVLNSALFHCPSMLELGASVKLCESVGHPLVGVVIRQ